jgi:chemotaxis protein CheX
MTVVTSAPPAAAKPQPGGRTIELYARLAGAFADAVRSVSETMAGVPVQTGAPARKEPGGPRYDVSGVIGFAGEIAGSLVIRFPLPVAAGLVTGLAGGMTFAPESSDFADAVGELANMVAGAAKSRIGKAASISVPVVIVGAGHAVPALSDVPVIVIPCTCQHGPFVLELNLKHQPSAAAE